MNNPVILHCNYVEQGQSIQQMCELAVKWGFDGIEFRRDRGKGESPTDYLDELEAAVNRTGLKYVLFGAPGPDLMLADAGERQREIDAYADFYRDAARRFTLTVCNTMAGSLHAKDAPWYEFEKAGSGCATDEQFAAAVEGFQALGDLASELGFKLAFELHMNYIHDMPEPARKLVDAIDRESVGLNIDYGNIVLYPPGPPTLAETLEICKGRTYLLHLKNVYKLAGLKYQNWVVCPLADGVINNREFLSILNEQGYDGPIVIEQPREGDRSWFAVEDLAYIKSVMSDLG